jgi:HEAT repeat protein
LTNLVREFSADALGRLRAKEAVKPILELVKTQDAGDVELVTFATNALVWIGDRSAVPELVKRAAAPGVVQARLIAGEAAALLGDPSIKAALAGAGAAKAPKQDSSRCMEQLAGLGQAAEDKEACASLQQAQARTFAQLQAPLDAAKECAQEAGCWSRKLLDGPPLVRARAAYELGRAGATEAVPALTKAAADEDLTARLAAIRALEWLVPVPAAREPLKGAAQQILEQLQKEQGKVKYVKVNEDLKRLQARMGRL